MFQVKRDMEGGGRELELEPPLETVGKEDISLRDVSRLCQLLNKSSEQEVDVDHILQGKPVKFPEQVGLRQAHEFMDLMLENPEAYDIESMPAYQVQSLLGVMTDHFISASRGN
jgi:hypothetical protein